MEGYHENDSLVYRANLDFNPVRWRFEGQNRAKQHKLQMQNIFYVYLVFTASCVNDYYN